MHEAMSSRAVRDPRGSADLLCRSQSSCEFTRAMSGRVARSLGRLRELETILEEIDASVHASSLECARLRAYVAQCVGLRRPRLRLVVSRR